MLAVLQFIFQDIVHFIGTLILIAVLGDAINGIIKIITLIKIKKNMDSKKKEENMI